LAGTQSNDKHRRCGIADKDAAGSDVEGERAAAMYTLIGSAKLNGIDPEAFESRLLSSRLQAPE
jgi:hypothetical protein